MKATHTIFKSAAAGIAVALICFSSGCTKDDSNNPPSVVHPPEQRVTDPGLIAKMDQQVQNMPKIAWYNSTMDKYIILDPNSESKDAEFVSPDIYKHSLPGATVLLFTDWNPYTLDDDITPYNFEHINRTPKKGGTVVTGNTNLNINHTETITPDSETEIPVVGGISGPDLSGAKVHIGIDGDVEALTTTNFNNVAQIFNHINGLIFYVAYTYAALGDFAILNWFDYLNASSSYLHGMAFVWVYAFTAYTWAIYLSQAGTLNATHAALHLTNAIFYAASRNLRHSGESGSSNHPPEYRENVRGYAFQRN